MFEDGGKSLVKKSDQIIWWCQLFFIHLQSKPKPNKMNQIGEVIDPKVAGCREMYLPDLMMLFKHSGSIFMSWGADGFIVDKQKEPKMFRMYVRGHHHKGHVYIFLNGMDLFDVYLTKSNGLIKDRTEEMGIYNDQLIDWIDEKVERIPEYR
jgi:hypothetical protein